MGWRVRLGAALVACIALLGWATPAVASSLLVPNLNWTSLLPPAGDTTADVQPGPVPYCETPSIDCINSTVVRLQAAQQELGCDHRGVFATTYLELTKAILGLLEHEPGIVRDPDYLYTEDSLFANFYFDAVSDWEAGRPVAPAWRIAFSQAETGQITGAQEMLLGINAHVQNDMPFVIAALGVREPDGTSRKPDHDAMNEALNRGYEPVIRAVRERFDPSMSLTNPDGPVTIDDIAGLELARTWRELVWRNAERLLKANTDAERDAVAQDIHANAAAWADGIALFQIPGFRDSRDAYCQQQLTG
jgi:hypothetical protein